MRPRAANSRAVTAIDAEPLTPAWQATLDQFDADLRRRAVAAKTRTAYASDCIQFARWASAAGLAPERVDIRSLRRYVATLSQRGQAPTTVARKLASLRGLLAVQVTRGERSDNPAELLSAPKRPQRLPRVLKPDEVAALLDRIPATTPLALRDRALFELAYASGLRAEELVTLDLGSIGFDEEAVRVHGKGDKTRIVPAGEHALAADRALSGGRPPGAAPRGGPGAPTAATRRRCSCRSRGDGSGPPTCGGGCACGRGWPPASRPRWPTRTRTRSGIRSRHTCWRVAPTCVQSRNYSVIPAFPPRRSTLGCSEIAFEPHMWPRIPERRANGGQTGH